MRKNTYLIIFSVILFNLYSCNIQKTEDFVRSSSGVSILCQIESSLPGELRVVGDYLYWTDMRTIDKFVHILDKNSGVELMQIVNIGQGPNEFSMPSFTTYGDSAIFVTDINENKQVCFLIDTSSIKQNILFRAKSNMSDIASFLFTKNNEMLQLYPGRDSLFSLRCDKKEMKFGSVFPDLKTKEPFSDFQGHLLYNADKDVFVYAMRRLPYMSIYERAKSGYSLYKEKIDHSKITLEKERFSTTDFSRGIIAGALMKDYIVTVEKEKYDEEDQYITEVSQYPTTLFLYDYNLNLKQIIDVGVNILRIDGDINNNMIYGICVKDDYCVFSFNLSNNVCNFD